MHKQQEQEINFCFLKPLKLNTWRYSDRDPLVKDGPLLPYHPELLLSWDSHCIVRICSYIHRYVFLVGFSLWFSWTICIYIIQEGYQKFRFQGSNPILINQILRKSGQRIYIFSKPSHCFYKFHEEPLCLTGWLELNENVTFWRVGAFFILFMLYCSI